MAELQDGAETQVFAEGVYLNDVLQSITLSADSATVAIDTFAGLSGFQNGPGKCTLDLTMVIMKGGPIFPFKSFMVAKKTLTMQVGAGPLSYAGKGRVTKVDLAKTSPDGATTWQVSWMGELKDDE
jgi:hypothetical protein